MKEPPCEGNAKESDAEPVTNLVVVSGLSFPTVQFMKFGRILPSVNNEGKRIGTHVSLQILDGINGVLQHDPSDFFVKLKIQNLVMLWLERIPQMALQ